jgi:uncharacterized protein (TIGR03032 family)
MSTPENRTTVSGSEERTVNLPPPYTGPKGQPTEIRCQPTENLAAVLAQANCSLLVSTYLIGNLVTVGSTNGELLVTFHTFDRPMGMAVSREGMVVCTRNQVWFLPMLLDIAKQMEPLGQYDLAYFARRSHYTGNILCHEIGWVGKELWIVNTRFSCLCTLHHTCHFAPRWQPPFTVDRVARYVTALAETNKREAWRAVKATSGCLIDVPNNTVIARGFAMPHSPRVANGRLYVLHSGRGRLEVVDPASGKTETVCDLPGYARGMSIHGSLAFIGLSKIRASTTMDGVPIAEKRDQLKCGVWAIDLNTGNKVAHLEFLSGIDELFDVQVLPGVTSPFVSGPLVDQYSDRTNWTLPPT